MGPVLGSVAPEHYEPLVEASLDFEFEGHRADAMAWIGRRTGIYRNVAAPSAGRCSHLTEQRPLSVRTIALASRVVLLDVQERSLLLKAAMMLNGEPQAVAIAALGSGLSFFKSSQRRELFKAACEVHGTQRQALAIAGLTLGARLVRSSLLEPAATRV